MTGFDSIPAGGKANFNMVPIQFNKPEETCTENSCIKPMALKEKKHPQAISLNDAKAIVPKEHPLREFILDLAAYSEAPLFGRNLTSNSLNFLLDKKELSDDQKENLEALLSFASANEIEFSSSFLDKAMNIDDSLLLKSMEDINSQKSLPKTQLEPALSQKLGISY